MNKNLLIKERMNVLLNIYLPAEKCSYRSIKRVICLKQKHWSKRWVLGTSNMCPDHPSRQFLTTDSTFPYSSKNSSAEYMSRAHSPAFPSLHLRHSSFSNPSVALPTSQFILQYFRCFTYVTAHSPSLISLLLRHMLFTKRHLAIRPWARYSASVP